MIAITTRKYGTGLPRLVIRVRENGNESVTALGVTITEHRWKYVKSALAEARRLSSQGANIVFQDDFVKGLWQLRSRLTDLEERGILTREAIYNEIEQFSSIKDLEDEITDEQEAVRMSSEYVEKPTLTEYIRSYIEDLETGRRLKRHSTQRVSASYIKAMKGLLSQFVEYQEEAKKEVDWDDVNMNFYNDFVQYFVRKKYSPNTIGKHINSLKTILIAAKAMHLTTKTDFENADFCRITEDIDAVYISESRLREMYELNVMNMYDLLDRARRIKNISDSERDDITKIVMSHQKRMTLLAARDIFLVGCYTGQRISDYKKVSLAMRVRLADGLEHLKIRQQKTGKIVYPLLTSKISDILSRWGGALPPISDQKLNENIKYICLLLGWTEPAALQKHQGNDVYVSNSRFFECVTSHTARRTFCTLAYRNNVPLSSIMAISGHSSEEILKRYLKLDQQERATLASKYFSRLADKL